jgi:hypothetical protein
VKEIFGIPTPCLHCGAPMTPNNVDSLHQSPTLRCAFCHRSEELPVEQAAQHRHLRLRLLQLRRSREAIEAPLKTFAMIRQSWIFGIVFFATIGGWQIWQATQATMMLQSMVFSVVSFSVVVGVLIGYVGMHKAFVGLIRPLQRARPPLETGLAARCRGCGADLPPVRSPHVECSFCGASNFLDTLASARVGELVDAERLEYQRRANGGQPHDQSAWNAPSDAFYRWGAIAAGLTFTVGCSVLALLYFKTH